VCSVAVVIGSWYWMQIIHECGHAGAAMLTGGRVTRLVLPFVSFSRTDVDPNTHPLIVAWGGALVGASLPLVLWIAAAKLYAPIAGILGYFAGFCLVANGAYIGVGSFNSTGDTGEMLLRGASLWQLWLFGLACVPLGLWIWHVLLNRVRARGGELRQSASRPLAALVFLGTGLTVVALA